MDFLAIFIQNDNPRSLCVCLGCLCAQLYDVHVCVSLLQLLILMRRWLPMQPIVSPPAVLTIPKKPTTTIKRHVDTMERPFPGYTKGLRRSSTSTSPATESAPETPVTDSVVFSVSGASCEAPSYTPPTWFVMTRDARGPTPSVVTTSFLPQETPHSAAGYVRNRFFDLVACQNSPQYGRCDQYFYKVPADPDSGAYVELVWRINTRTRGIIRYITARMKRVKLDEQRYSVIVQMGENTELDPRKHFFGDWPEVVVVDNKKVHFHPILAGRPYSATHPRFSWTLNSGESDEFVDHLQGRWVVPKVVLSSSVELK